MKEQNSKSSKTRKPRRKVNYTEVLDKVSKTIDVIDKGTKVAKAMGLNHPEWYTKDMAVSTNLTWNALRGNTSTSLNIHMMGSVIKVALNKPYAVVSTNVIRDMTTEGSIRFDNGVDFTAWDTAVSLLYAKIRAANSGSVNYTVGEFGSYLLNAFNLYAAYHHVVRGIKIIQSVDKYDRQSPIPLYKLFVSTNDANYNSDLSSIADLRDSINILNRKMSATVPLPPMTMLDKIQHLFGNVFKDADSVKESYMGYKLGYITFWENGTIMATNDIDDQSLSTIINTMIYGFNTMVSGVNVTIAGDIAKAFGNDAYPKLPYISMDSMVTPVHDKWVYDQYQNVLAGHVKSSLAHSYFMAEGVGPVTVLEAPGNSVAGNADYDGLFDSIVNSPSDTIVPGHALSLTANSSAIYVTATQEAPNGLLCLATTSDGFAFIGAYYLGYVGNILTMGSIPTLLHNIKDINLNTAIAMTQLPEIPRITYMDYDTQNNRVGYLTPLGDISTYAMYSYEQAKAFQQQRVLSMLHSNSKLRREGTLSA